MNRSDNKYLKKKNIVYFFSFVVCIIVLFGTNSFRTSATFATKKIPQENQCLFHEIEDELEFIDSIDPQYRPSDCVPSKNLINDDGDIVLKLGSVICISDIDIRRIGLVAYSINIIGNFVDSSCEIQEGGSLKIVGFDRIKNLFHVTYQNKKYLKNSRSCPQDGTFLFAYKNILKDIAHEFNTREKEKKEFRDFLKRERDITRSILSCTKKEYGERLLSDSGKSTVFVANPRPLLDHNFCRSIFQGSWCDVNSEGVFILKGCYEERSNKTIFYNILENCQFDEGKNKIGLFEYHPTQTLDNEDDCPDNTLFFAPIRRDNSEESYPDPMEKLPPMSF